MNQEEEEEEDKGTWKQMLKSDFICIIIIIKYCE